MDRNEIVAEFQRLHALSKTGPLDETNRQRWTELKRLLIVLDQPDASRAPLLEPCADEPG